MREGIVQVGKMVLAVTLAVMFLVCIIFMVKNSSDEMNQWFFSALWFFNGMMCMGIISRRFPLGH